MDFWSRINSVFINERILFKRIMTHYLQYLGIDPALTVTFDNIAKPCCKSHAPLSSHYKWTVI